jgi:hypothetical protein
MPKPELVATRGFKYMTRRLLPGDTFEAKNSLEAKILTDVRRVAAVPLPKLARRPQLDHDKDGREGGSKTAVGDDLAALRAAYVDKFGKRPFNGWPVEVLREKIAGTTNGG